MELSSCTFYPETAIVGFYMSFSATLFFGSFSSQVAQLFPGMQLHSSIHGIVQMSKMVIYPPPPFCCKSLPYTIDFDSVSVMLNVPPTFC